MVDEVSLGETHFIGEVIATHDATAGLDHRPRDVDTRVILDGRDKVHANRLGCVRGLRLTKHDALHGSLALLGSVKVLVWRGHDIGNVPEQGQEVFGLFGLGLDTDHRELAEQWHATEDGRRVDGVSKVHGGSKVGAIKVVRVLFHQLEDTVAHGRVKQANPHGRDMTLAAGLHRFQGDGDLQEPQEGLEEPAGQDSDGESSRAHENLGSSGNRLQSLAWKVDYDGFDTRELTAVPPRKPWRARPVRLGTRYR